MIAREELDVSELKDFLLDIAPIYSVYIWGPPGIGKSSIVNEFSYDLDLECVTLLGSQLAAEDLIGIPQISKDEKNYPVSRFVTPSSLVRHQEFCLFIDELNTASTEVQKAFYSLILDKRIGDYHLPKGSIVIGAGNRAADSALVKQLPSALVNRMIHVHLKVNHKLWLDWAVANEVHPWIIEYIQQRPGSLHTPIAPSNEEPFSTPRSWKAVSDGLKSIGQGKKSVEREEKITNALLYGSLSEHHVTDFKAFIKQIQYRFSLPKIFKGEVKWPRDPKDRDILLFLVTSARDYLISELPREEDKMSGEKKKLVIDVKNSLKELTHIDAEYAQNILAPDEKGNILPSWFLTEITKELPRLIIKSDK
jgi:hypothetical protein